MVYVLTEGWYSDMSIKGVVSSESAAESWAEQDKYRDYYSFEIGDIDE